MEVKRLEEGMPFPICLKAVNGLAVAQHGEWIGQQRLEEREKEEQEMMSAFPG